ncbi:MAG TPA: protease inhibitor I42 family protein [Anaerolineales bacterium]
MKGIFYLLVAMIFVNGCTTSSSTPTPTLPPTAASPTILPEPSDPTQLITVQAGETFDIVVPSNPSTGYHWEIIPELDETIVQLAAQGFIAEQPVMPGSGGMDVWTFQAVNAGETTIVLGYYPPGNENDPEEVLTFSIHVE